VEYQVFLGQELTATTDRPGISAALVRDVGTPSVDEDLKDVLDYLEEHHQLLSQGTWRRVQVRTSALNDDDEVFVGLDWQQMGNVQFVVAEHPEAGWVVVPAELSEFPDSKDYGVSLPVVFPDGTRGGEQAVDLWFLPLSETPKATALRLAARRKKGACQNTSAMNFKYRLRTWTPNNFKGEGQTIKKDSEFWNRAKERLASTGLPLLLVIHGTGLQTELGLAGLGKSLVSALHDRYAAVFAFDHKTVDATPEQNWKWFARQLPKDIPRGIPLHILTVSRGALVARALTEGWSNPLPRWSSNMNRVFEVERVVMIVPPNDGTPTSKLKRVPFLNRARCYERGDTDYSWGNSADGTLQDAIDSFFSPHERVMQGARVQREGSPYLDRFNRRELIDNSSYTHSATYYVACSEFRDSSGPGTSLCNKAKRVFRIQGIERPNDLIIPTSSAWNPLVAQRLRQNNLRFPVSGRRLLLLDDEETSPTHKGAVKHPDVHAFVLRWLNPTGGNA